MSDYTLEQKLAILEKMKQDQERNRFAMGRRSAGERTERISVVSTMDESRTMQNSFGKLRFLFALFLLLGYFYIHFTGFSYKTFDAKAVETMIDSNFSINQAKDFLKNIEKNLPFL